VNILGLVLTLAVIALPAAVLAQDHVHDDPVPNFLSAENREFGSRLLMQDMRGRMKPLDTYVREQPCHTCPLTPKCRSEKKHGSRSTSG
jgi:hypothetical protein